MFAAFSGSHQDAIAKGMKYREEKGLSQWNVPYIPIDPHDISRTYDADVIRVNSQSGKGGIGYLLEQSYGYVLPSGMRENLSYLCKSVSDHEHKELKVDEILKIFKDHYFIDNKSVDIAEMHFIRKGKEIQADITFIKNNEKTVVTATGNGTLDAVSNGLKKFTGKTYELLVYTEHSMQEEGSKSVAVAYIGIRDENGTLSWGAGTNTDIIHASADALLNAFHNAFNK